MINNQTVGKGSFIDFIFKDKKNRLCFGLAILLNIGEILVFKGFWYTHANFWISSSGFVEAAASHASTGLWPIGYSWFLLAFHGITHSATALVVVQYFFLTGVLLYFFYTLHYFYTLGKDSYTVLFLFLFFDPLFLFIANYVTNDALFLGFSLWWFTGLVWVLHRPKPYQVITQALLLFISFTLSYNAAYYPLISILAFGLSRQPLAWKISGPALGIGLLVLFAIHARNANYREAGVSEFSVLSEWRKANNALFMYPYIEVDRSHMPAKYVPLDNTVRRYFQHCDPKFLEVSPRDGLFYVDQATTPLHTYIFPDERRDHPIVRFKEWVAVSPLYEDYAHYLIGQHQGAYLRYYLLPNVREYFLPRLDMLVRYNMDRDTVSTSIKNWFDYPTPKVPFVYKGIPRIYLSPFPILFLFVNIAFIVGIIWLFLVRKRWQVQVNLRHGLYLAAFFLLSNGTFSLWSSPIVLDTQVFPMIVCFGFVLLLYDFFEKKYKAV